MGDVFKRNNVAVRGKGQRLVVFAHGLGCDQRVWEAVAARLDADYRLALFDYVGSGRSDRAAYDPARYASVADYARDLTEVVDALGGPPPVLVGHSISAAVGVVASVARPALFERMVLLAPSPRYLDDLPDYVGGFQPADIAAVLDLMDRNFLGWSTSFAGFVAKEPRVIDVMTDFLSASDPRATRRFAEMTFNIDIRGLLPEVPVPSLIVQCRNDAVAPESVGELMHRLMPRSTYELVDVVGHCPHLSDPRSIAGLVHRFIQEGP
ncbi:MAG TPA: alpha/beta hydrolase [Polyangia bacterium]|nr:alpha/beta hydrolase [Polyangia bacterium]